MPGQVTALPLLGMRLYSNQEVKIQNQRLIMVAAECASQRQVSSSPGPAHPRDGFESPGLVTGLATEHGNPGLGHTPWEDSLLFVCMLYEVLFVPVPARAMNRMLWGTPRLDNSSSSRYVQSGEADTMHTATNSSHHNQQL